MLQIGPLTTYLYKSSVTVRGYYWRAGIEMFKDNPFFGVGFDRYGAYFKEFREVGYPLAYGFQITSSNAHNVPIQFFSTSGIFVGLIYLIILGFIAWSGINGIRRFEGNDKLLLASVFSAWLAYQAQTIISIDNIGISIWGWVLGGAVIGVSRRDNLGSNPARKVIKSKGVTFNLRQTFISTILVVLALTVVVPLYQVEKTMFNTRMVFNPSVPESKTALYELATKSLENRLLEPSYKTTLGTYLAVTGFTVDGLNTLKEVVGADKRNLDALMSLAEFHGQLGDLEVANDYRLQIAKYDPFNAANYLQLGRNYKALGNVEKMNEMRAKILSFAPNTEEAKQAISELN
jgi:hypothetical protein